MDALLDRRPDASGDAGAGTEPEAVEVCIVGTGFAGLGTAIKLKEAGIGPFVVLEKGDDVGGTWRDNRYPGCACDIPSHLYSFSFECNPDWTRMYPTQPEIWDYLRRVADRYGLRPHIRFNTTFEGAAWDGGLKRWKVRMGGGRTLLARFLVLGVGGLSRPTIPDIPGRDSFQGPTFHSAWWDHGVDLAGKRVVVIGTGASAIQFVPQIAPQAGHVTLFQRTPPWILPKMDRPIRPWERALFRNLPGVMRLFRWMIYLRQEALALGFTVNPRLMKRAEKMARDHLEASITDPALRAVLTPDYQIGCKRVLISNDYYPAVARDNVELVTAGIDRITPDGVLDRAGRLHRADVLVWGTGFTAVDYPGPTPIIGADGVELKDAFHDAAGPSGGGAYLGTTVAGFPNLFTLTGPNTGLGHNSIVFIIEAQLHLVISALKSMRAGGAATIEPKPGVQKRFNQWLVERMRRTVWLSGCKSWYLDETGRNTTLWPGFTVSFWWRTRRADMADYALDAPHPTRAEAAPAAAE